MLAVGLTVVLISACLAWFSYTGPPTTDSTQILPAKSSVTVSSEVIDSVGTTGRYTSIAVDSNDKLHISYYDYTTRDLRYATNASGTWTTETVDSEGDVGAYTSIAVDSNDKIHISYHKATIDSWSGESQGDLKYATGASGSWVTETIEMGSGVTSGMHTSIAVDSNDKIHISYCNSVTLIGNTLRYATNASGAWAKSTIDTVSHGGQYSSIAVDSNDKIHISYYCEEMFHNDLKYATDASGSWVVSTIDHYFQCVLGYFTSLAIDSNDKIHISYYNNSLSGYDLKYATDSSGSWTTDTLDSAGDVGRYTSIAIDSNDRIHISYYDVTNTNLKYATDASGPWVTETVDDEVGTVGWETSIAVDSLDNLHISYADFSAGDLKYAMISDPPEPIPEFSGVVIPVVAMVIMVMAAGRVRNRRKDSRSE